MQGPIAFVVPELAEKTLMNKEHNELQAKLEFVLSLVETIVQLAVERGSPLSESVLLESVAQGSRTSLMMRSSLVGAQFLAEDRRCMEQLHLYVRALTLLSSSMQLAHDSVEAHLMQNTTSMRRLLREMNEAYQHCLTECQRLKCSVTTDSVMYTSQTADKLLYGLALEKCQCAATDEMLGNIDQCVTHYRAAYLILHGLSQQAGEGPDKELLCKYTEMVGKRFVKFSNQGFFSSTKRAS